MSVTFANLGSYGRKGNAMFQIAATIGYAKKYDVPFFFPEWEHQKEFSLPESFFLPKKSIHFSSEIREARYTYSDLPFQKDCSLSGYFQSWKYFDHCSDYIREIFTLREKENNITFKGLCAVHVRRGDYLQFPDHHPTLDMSYYKAAMERVPASKFLIFSEDVQWCRENFVGPQFIVTEPASSAIDFKMQMSCNHFIIGNSSFSWWAAWLGTHSDKVVIAPKKWFGPALEATHPTHDLIPPDWVIV